MNDKYFAKAVKKAKKEVKRKYDVEQIKAVDAPMEYLAVDAEAVNCLVIYQTMLRRQLFATRLTIFLLIIAVVVGDYYGF